MKKSTTKETYILQRDLHSYSCVSWVKTRVSCVWRDSFMCVTWLVLVCDVTHSCVSWGKTRMSCASYVTWILHMCDTTDPYVWHDSFICVTWLINVCDMTPVYVLHYSFLCVTWLIHICHESRLEYPAFHVWRDSFTCVTRLSLMCDMTHSYVWHDSSICVTWLSSICDMTHGPCTHIPDTLQFLLQCILQCVLQYVLQCLLQYVCNQQTAKCRGDVSWLIHMCDMTQFYMRHDSWTLHGVGEMCQVQVKYGAATMSRLPKNIGLFCKRTL